MIKKIYSILLFILISKWGVAVGIDSVNKYGPNTVRFITLSAQTADTLFFEYIDTNYIGFQNFHPASTQNIPFLNLGNLGTATQPLFFENTDLIGFQEGWSAFNHYLTSAEKIKYYRTASPYTQLKYFWNRKQEQLFAFTFAQNISPRLNYAVNYTRLVSVGDYQLQKTDHLNLDASIWYTSKNNRYKFWFAAMSNNLTAKENGGVKSDSVFNSNPIYDPLFEPVKLSAASNQLRQTEIYFKQSYAFGKTYKLSLDSISIDKVENKYRFSHAFNYLNKVINFNESKIDSGYYANAYIDATRTADYTQLKKFSSLLSYEYYNQAYLVKSQLKSFTISLKNQLVLFQNNNFDTTLSEHHLIATSEFQLAPKITYTASADYIFAGVFKSNYFFHSVLTYNLFQSKLIAKLGFSTSSQSPVFNALQAHNNHYQWANQFVSVQNQKAYLQLDIKSIAASIKFMHQQISNYVYFDTQFAPQQLSSNISLNTICFSKQITWRALHFDNYIYLQQSSNQQILPQPSFHIYNSTYVQLPIFKAALKLRAGLDTRYYSAYQAYAYSPANMMFHLGTKNLGGFPIVDVFVTAKLKRAVLLFKLEHANNLLNSYGEMMVSNYPIAPRTFKLGLLWNFYD
jgi:hypothetical protein